MGWLPVRPASPLDRRPRASRASRAGRGQGAGHGCTGAEGLGEVLTPRPALGPVRDAARAQRAGGQGGAGTAGVHGVAAAGRRRGCLRGVTVCVRVPCPRGRAPHRAGCGRGPHGVHLSSAPALPAQAQGPRGDPVPAGVAIDCHGRRDSRRRPTARETAQLRNRAGRCIDGPEPGRGGIGVSPPLREARSYPRGRTAHRRRLPPVRPMTQRHHLSRMTGRDTSEMPRQVTGEERHHPCGI